MVLNEKLNKLRKATLLAGIQVLAESFHVLTTENHKYATQTTWPWV